MVEKKLTFSLFDANDGPNDSRPGGLVPDIAAALLGIQEAVRLMVQHLGNRERGPGLPANWIRDQSRLRMVDTQTGSYVGGLVVDAPLDSQPYLDDFGNRALEALQAWDGKGPSALPEEVVGTLHVTAARLSDGVQLWFGDAENPRRVLIERRTSTPRTSSGVTEALLHGWLYEVNWDRQTAQLHDFSGEYVNLRFAEDLNEDMLRLATRFVEVRGRGRFNDNDQWTTVEVQQLNEARSWNEPFDVEAFLNDPNSMVFDPAKVVITSEPFDVDEFIRGIHEGRDVRRERPE